MKPLLAINVAKYLLTHAEPDKGEVISHTTLQLLLYLAQKEHIYRNLRPLFKEFIIRWDTMPVVVQVWDVYKKYGRKAIDVGTEDLDYGKMDTKTKKFLSFIYHKYSQLSKKKLYEMVMSQVEIKRSEIGHLISFDVMYGQNLNEPVIFSLSSEFKEVYSALLPIIKEFKVERFVARRLGNKTLDVLVVSEEFNNNDVRYNVRRLVDFSFECCPELHNFWLVTFRPRGIKKITEKIDNLDIIKLC